LTESRRLSAFRRVAEHGGARAIDDAWERLVRRGTPLVEKIPRSPGQSLVTFVWRPARVVKQASISSPALEPVPESTRLSLIEGTGVWTRTFRWSDRLRASYGFSDRPHPTMADDEKAWTNYMLGRFPDPWNPRQLLFPKDPDDPKDKELAVSIVELPSARAPTWNRPLARARYVEERHRVVSRVLRNERSLWVELPPDFRPERDPCNLLIVFDGPVYRTTIPTPTIIERLVRARRIRPTVVVLLPAAPGSRAQEFGCNPRFNRFLLTELLPWLGRRYRLRVPPERTVLAGSSLGAVAATFAAFHHPERFGNVLAQSGAFPWPCRGPAGRPSTLMEVIATAPRRPVRFYLDAGRLERVPVPPEWDVSLLGGVHHLRDVLVAKGYTVKYVEFEGGHDYAGWSGTLAGGIEYLLPRH